MEIPESYSGKTVIYSLNTVKQGGWDVTNPQFLVFINDKPIQALDTNHKEVLLCENAISGDVFKIALLAYTGLQNTNEEFNSNISVLDKNIEKLYYNIKVPLKMIDLLSTDDKNTLNILKYLTNTINMLDLRKPFSNSFHESMKLANLYLEKEFYDEYCGNSDVTAICVGHTHIDVAWLWTISQTREKVVRSFSTVLNLMKQYPEYIFMSSQPQLYQFIKEDHPEIYEEIKAMVRQGRWEVEGAMWLEADCNLTSGESLVRQIMFGKQFFKDEFGVDSKLLWLPDVFGYSAALPQIMKKSGIDYFMTTKIGWNEYNKMPYDTFMWRGIDGTEVLTHFITTKDYDKTDKPTASVTYNGVTNPSQIMGAWQRYQQKELSDEVLVCYGYGDGGGGPTKEMLETARRLEKGIPGSPRVKMGKAMDFFKTLDKNVSNNKKLPKWVGELYLEYHRGTYTTNGKIKKQNRKSEFLYQDLEMFSTIDMSMNGENHYNQMKINDGWKKILLNQFHDIIPGSSIKPVYEVADKQYIHLMNSGRDLLRFAMASIISNIKLNQTSVVVFNQLGFKRSDVAQVELPVGWCNALVFDGKILVESQLTENNIIFFAKDIPSKGYKVFSLKKEESKIVQGNFMEMSKQNISNKFFNIEFDKDYNITSIFDKISSREILKAGERGNVLQAFEDKPIEYDAWDINIFYGEKMWEINQVEGAEVIENGPVRSSIKITRKFLDSTIIQTIHIYKDISRIDFSNWIDWKEKQILLKAAFPLDIHADKATYEIQYGNVERPTHWNTSWDYARFEVCAHKWADISEDNYGVSLLNDCKYGHDIKDSVMRLTLIKSAIKPNVDTDRVIHEFKYSLYPHVGDWKSASTVEMAYNLNCPLYTLIEEPHEGYLEDKFSFIALDKENVVIEVVKKAESSNDIIVRLYECFNRRVNVKATLFKSIDEIYECDLLENNTKTLTTENNAFHFEIKPYEIKTFKIKLL